MDQAWTSGVLLPVLHPDTVKTSMNALSDRIETQHWHFQDSRLVKFVRNLLVHATLHIRQPHRPLRPHAAGLLIKYRTSQPTSPTSRYEEGPPARARSTLRCRSASSMRSSSTSWREVSSRSSCRESSCRSTVRPDLVPDIVGGV